MAKSSMKAREAKRTKLVAKYAEKRAALKAIISNVETSEEVMHQEEQVGLSANKISLIQLLVQIRLLMHLQKIH